MHKNETTKNLKVIFIILLCVAAVVFFAYRASTKVIYESDDPLHGSYRVENRPLNGRDVSTDFLISVDAELLDSLKEIAEENGVDKSERYWVYSFEENKVFKVKKGDNIIEIFENEVLVGAVEYTYKKFLWKKYDERYLMSWRGEDCILFKESQGFIIPHN